MTIHTSEAMRLYFGVTPDPDSTKYGISGGRRAAAALRQLYVLTSRDNPYADMMLVHLDGLNTQATKAIEAMEKKFINLLEQRKKRGLVYGIVEARTPQTLELGYRSPYGFMVTNTIVSFDYMVRVLKSAQMRDLMTKTELHDDLERIKSKLRSMFEFAARAQRILLNKNMQALCRTDYANRTVEGDQRILAAKQAFGDVPNDVFMHKREPRHTLWKQTLSKAELDLLQQLADHQELAATTTSADLQQVQAPGLVD